MNRRIQASLILSPMMDILRRHTIALSRIVSVLLSPFQYLETDTSEPLATQPSCMKGVMQFQHGKFTKESNGSLILMPFALDGRQLVSNPCASQYSMYLRYNQTEIFKVYS